MRTRCANAKDFKEFSAKAFQVHALGQTPYARVEGLVVSLEAHTTRSCGATAG